MVVLLLSAGIAEVMPASGIGPSGFARIRPGMTRAQVAAAVGMPAGVYTELGDGCRGANIIGEWGFSTSEDEDVANPHWEEWLGDSYILAVHYGTDGAADGCAVAEITPSGGNYLGKLLWKARRLWREWFP
jgi:hypothetical protein